MADGMERRDDGDYVLLRYSRRKNLRSQLLVLKVKAEDERGVFFGYAKTIGRGGMFISSVNPRNIGEEFEIIFTPPGYREAARCRCEVVWRRGFDPSFKSEPGMGIRFVDLDAEIADRIEEWVRRGVA